MGLRKRIGKLRRLFFVTGVLLKMGGGILASKIRQKYLKKEKSRFLSIFIGAKREDFDNGEVPKSHLIFRLREVLERLGPTFVKLGQALSLRPDLVGDDLAGELSKLQDQATPFTFEEVKRIIREELRYPPEDLFNGFDARPFAAASLAQVHRARLKDGTEVAIKVQRPGIKKVIEQDLQILLRLAHYGERYMVRIRPYHPVLVTKEFADWTIRELDFSVEGHNADRFRFSFRNNPKVKIPQVYWKYTGSRVLTMEFIQGVRVDDLAGIKMLASDGKEVMRHLLEAFVQQFLTDGFFHADPHPGNVYVLKNNAVCFTDFGMVGYLNEALRRELLSCFVAFVDGDMEGYLRHFMHLAEQHSDSDVAGFRKDAAEILNELFFSQNPLSMAHLFFRLINKGAARRITFPTGLALFAKAIATTESIGRQLYKKFDLNTELPPYIQRAAEDYLDPANISRSLYNNMFDHLEFLRNLPEQVNKALNGFGEGGQITVKIDAAQLHDIKKELDRHTDTRTLGTLAVSVLIGTLLLLYFEHAGIIWRPFSSAGFGLFVALLLWYLAKRRRRDS